MIEQSRRQILVALIMWISICMSVGMNACRAAAAATHYQNPNRIISLSPGITEILFALGLGAKVVGDTAYCNYPPAAMKIIHVGDSAVNYEEVVALKPDLIIADSLANEAGIPKLLSLHQPVDSFAFSSLSDEEMSITQIGKLTGAVAQAARLVANMNEKVKEAQLRVRIQSGTVRYVFLVGAKPLWVAGKKSFISSTLGTIGAVNIAPNTDYQSWSMESLIAAQPNVIFCSADDMAVIKSDPVWQSIPATRKGNIFLIVPDISERPGPRIADGLVAISKQIASAKL